MLVSKILGGPWPPRRRRPCKDEFCNEKVESWIKELGSLHKIAKMQPQAAYIAFSRGYRSKFTYFLRTIEGFEDYVQPIDDFLNDSFPTLFGRGTPFPKHLTIIHPSNM